MKPSRDVTWVAASAGVLALATASGGLFWPSGGSPFLFTTLRGEEVQIFGRGIYHYDALSSAPTFIGTDVVTICLMVPLLAYALWLRSHGSLRGELLLVSMVGVILYNSFHMAFAAAYNQLFLLYVAFFSASLFAFVLAVNSIDLAELRVSLSTKAPRRGPATFLIVAGAVLAVVWLSDIVPALLESRPPLSLGSSTTTVTYAIDLAVVVPATVLAGVLLLRKRPLGYLLGTVFLVVNAVVGVVVAAQTVAGLALGVPLTPGTALVLVVPFLLMALIAGWLMVGMLRGILPDRARRPGQAHLE